MSEEFIRSTRHHLTFLVLVVLVLLYQVFYVQRNQLKALSSHHKEAFSRLQCDGTGVFNPYATRNQTIVDNGLTNSNVLLWGNEPGSLMKTTLDNSNSSTFLGSPEPPVFYDIGDVREVRKTRHKSQSNTGISADPSGGLQFSYTYKKVPVVDDQGNVTEKLEYIRCPSSKHIVKDNVCIMPPPGHRESARFMPIDNFADGDDRGLLAAAQGGENSY
jgi:hypothetical protein